MDRQRVRIGKGLFLSLIGGLLTAACDVADPDVLLPDRERSSVTPGAARGEGPSSSRRRALPTVLGQPAATRVTVDEAATSGAAAKSVRGSTGTGRESKMDSIGPGDSTRVYYQFTDDRGRVRFAERLADVPEAWRGRVGFVEMDRPPPLRPEDARRSWRLDPERTAEILLAAGPAARVIGGHQQGEVVLYSAEWCGYCRQAQAHLDRGGVQYELRDVDVPAAARELLDKTGRGGVPVLDFGGQILRGYSPEQYDRAIAAIRS